MKNVNFDVVADVGLHFRAIYKNKQSHYNTEVSKKCQKKPSSRRGKHASITAFRCF